LFQVQWPFPFLRQVKFKESSNPIHTLLAINEFQSLFLTFVIIFLLWCLFLEQSFLLRIFQGILLFAQTRLFLYRILILPKSSVFAFLVISPQTHPSDSYIVQPHFTSWFSAFKSGLLSLSHLILWKLWLIRIALSWLELLPLLRSFLTKLI